MEGIIGYGGYLPRLRLERRAVVAANNWYAPHLAGKGKGTRTMANWDEDSLTMAVAAARDCLGAAENRSHVRALYVASATLPYAERLNAGVVAEALTLDENVRATDLAGSLRAGLSAFHAGLADVRTGGGHALVVAADHRLARPASSQELDYGDGAAALLLGSDGVLAECLATATLSVDFIDHFRMSGHDIDYHWEERWVRDEGIAKLMPRVIADVLGQAGVTAQQIDHFIFPTTFARSDLQLAKQCGMRPEAVTDNLAAKVGDTGTAHPLLILAYLLERAQPGALILVAQFASGGEAVLFRVTDAIRSFRPAKGVAQWLERGVPETEYTKYLSFTGQLELERGMRGEQDKKTALSTAYRHKSALLGLVAGRCEVTGKVHFPPSRLSYDPGQPLLDTQRPYKLAERRAHVLSWSAETLSFHRSPPHYYGQVDFVGGGRILMEFTDVRAGDIDAGTELEMCFRIKDVDDRRGFARYFWKATPVAALAHTTAE